MADVTATIEVHGLAELDALLRGLPTEVTGPIVEEALKASGDVVRQRLASNIHSRTEKTAKSLRVVIQLEPPVGVAAIGSKDRGYILRFLEFGTGPHPIVAGASERRRQKRAARALRKLGARVAPAAAERHALGRWPAGIPGWGWRSRVKHPGAKAQAVMSGSLADAAAEAITVLRDVLWKGISAAVDKLKKAA